MDGVKNILVIATVPKDETHAVALWSELECVTGSGIDLVVLSAPDWSRDLVEAIADRVRKQMLHVPRLLTRYYKNDRYDAGLWCDALQDIPDVSDLSSILLLNDSVFFMRSFTRIQDRLAENTTLDMVSLSYSNTGSDLLGGRPWFERSVIVCSAPVHSAFCVKKPYIVSLPLYPTVSIAALPDRLLAGLCSTHVRKIPSNNV